MLIKQKSQLLFISYKFVEGFFAITFLLLVISSWNFQNMCQRFLYSQKRNFSWIRQKKEKLPHRPPLSNSLTLASSCLQTCKNRSRWQRHVYRHYLVKVWDFYNGVYGEILYLLLDPAEISFLISYKTFTHTMQVSARNKQ